MTLSSDKGNSLIALDCTFGPSSNQEYKSSGGRLLKPFVENQEEQYLLCVVPAWLAWLGKSLNVSRMF